MPVRPGAIVASAIGNLGVVSNRFLAVPPAAAPARAARVLTLLSIVGAGACGGLIGFAVTDLSCSNGCTVKAGLIGVAGAIGAAGGVAVVAVLALRAMAEWGATRTPRRIDGTGPDQEPGSGRGRPRNGPGRAETDGLAAPK